MREKGCATWDGGNSTWGGRARVFGTVPVCVRVQERAGGEGHVLAGRFVKGALFRLKIFFGKLKSRWSGPFTIAKIYPYRTAKLIHPDGCNFKVNCHRLKYYHGGDPPPLEILDVTTFPKDN
nr:reverse transcriptase domain-containing protein [Tanacetum cinerariifolium]